MSSTSAEQRRAGDGHRVRLEGGPLRVGGQVGRAAGTGGRAGAFCLR
ncbi:hypothetical protein AB0O86_26700 [Streptomyces hirsutus]